MKERYILYLHLSMYDKMDEERETFDMLIIENV